MSDHLEPASTRTLPLFPPVFSTCLSYPVWYNPFLLQSINRVNSGNSLCISKQYLKGKVLTTSLLSMNLLMARLLHQGSDKINRPLRINSYGSERKIKLYSKIHLSFLKGNKSIYFEGPQRCMLGNEGWQIEVHRSEVFSEFIMLYGSMT